jgi:hypothetical protein
MDDENTEGPMDRAAENEAHKEKLAEEGYERIKGGSHWRDWRFIADGFAVGRTKAYRMVGTNNQNDPRYKRAFKAWMDERPWARSIDKATRNHLFWVADNHSEIDAWRETLAQNERDKLNHPTTLKRKFDAAHRLGVKDPNAPKKETTREALLREIEAKDTEIKELKHRVQQMLDDGEGSLFDLKRDSVEAIVDTISGNVSIGRFDSLKNAMVKKFAALKAADKIKKAHAG